MRCRQRAPRRRAWPGQRLHVCRRLDRADDRRVGCALPDRARAFQLDLLLRHRGDLSGDAVRRPAAQGAGGSAAAALEKGAIATVVIELATFIREAYRAFTGSRAALVGVLVSLLPIGAYALSLALQSNLAVELGLSDNQIAQLNLVSTVVFAIACVCGGWLSDRYGRRRMLALFIFLTVIPTLWLAWTMLQQHWIMPVEVNMPNRPQPSDVLLITFWTAVIFYNVFQGLYYGVRSALFMDVTTPAVAATQFTAYMAMANLVITYTSWWQGLSIVRWGYPVTLGLDAAFGLIVLFLLPFMAPKREAEAVRVPSVASRSSG